MEKPENRENIFNHKIQERVLVVSTLFFHLFSKVWKLLGKINYKYEI